MKSSRRRQSSGSEHYVSSMYQQPCLRCSWRCMQWTRLRAVLQLLFSHQNGFYRPPQLRTGVEDCSVKRLDRQGQRGAVTRKEEFFGIFAWPFKAALIPIHQHQSNVTCMECRYVHHIKDVLEDHEAFGTQEHLYFRLKCSASNEMNKLASLCNLPDHTTVQLLVVGQKSVFWL